MPPSNLDVRLSHDLQRPDMRRTLPFLVLTETVSKITETVNSLQCTQKTESSDCNQPLMALANHIDYSLLSTCITSFASAITPAIEPTAISVRSCQMPRTATTPRIHRDKKTWGRTFPKNKFRFFIGHPSYIAASLQLHRLRDRRLKTKPSFFS